MAAKWVKWTGRKLNDAVTDAHRVTITGLTACGLWVPDEWDALVWESDANYCIACEGVTK